jgi:hypothetical protein
MSPVFDVVLDVDKLHGFIIFHRLNKLNHRLVNASVDPCLTEFLFHGNGINPLKGNRHSHQLDFVHNSDNGMLIFGGAPTNNVFLGYCPEQDRYRNEIREFNGEIWASCMTHVKDSCCRLTDLSQEYLFDLE